MIYILVAAACFLLWLFPGVRCALTHPFHCIYYGVKDGYNYIRYKQGNLRKTGNLDIFCGYFGNGKTLSLVKQVVCREYKRYDGLTVWCNRRQKFVTQRILILSNVDLCVPYERLTGLAQVCAISKANEIYDDEHDTLTITIVCMDELSVQMNSRSFKDNINAYFLNTLMCCRHYHISFYGSAQRFQHVDKMLRDVTMNVVQCKKVWRFQFNSYYDGFQLETRKTLLLFVRCVERAGLLRMLIIMLTILCRSWIICKNPSTKMICSPKQKFLLIRLHLLPLAWMLLLPVEKPKRL